LSDREGAREALGRLFDVSERLGPFASEFVQLLPHPVFSARADGRIDFISRRWQELTGCSVKAPSLESLSAAIPETERSRFIDEWNRGLARGARFKLEMLVSTRDGERWQRLEATPVRTASGRLRKWLGTITDIDEARRAIVAIEESEARLRFLEDAGRAVAESLDTESVANVACRELVGPFADGASIECADVRDQGLLVGEGCKPCDLVATRKQLFGEPGSSLQYASALDGAFIGCALVVLPIRSGQRILGSLTLVANPLRAALGSDDLAVLSIFARRIGSALENANLYARQRRVAETLQAALLPQHFPVLAGVQFDSVYLPNTDEANVGGDWYDAFDLGEGRSAVSIGDVAGHGLSAATIMGSVRTAIRAAALNGGTPDVVLARANRLLFSESRTMVTALFGIIDSAAAMFRYAVAGHPPPLILSPDGSIRYLTHGGPPLGIMRNIELQERSESLNVDDTLLLYTDGIVEYEHDALAGERRLEQCAARWVGAGRPGGVAALAQSVLGSRKPADDIAILTATLLPKNVIDVTVPAEPRHSWVLRETVREFAEGCNLDKGRLNDLVQTVGEAVNNAILHAYQDEPGTVRVRARREECGIVVEVLDTGRWRSTEDCSSVSSRNDLTLAENGRGLMLMRCLADNVEVATGEEGTLVRLTLN